MPTDPMQRLLARIEAASGLDLNQRASELEQWLRAREVARTPFGAPFEEATIDRFTDAIASADSEPLAELLGRFTVSYTRFFRDAEQLSVVTSALAALQRRPAHIWIAGCSTGEEAYTMALLCRDRGCEVEIVASDINRQSLAQAQAACYAREALKVVPQKYHQEFLGEGAQVELSPRIRRRVTFVEHSLTQPPLKPADGTGWDLILCRNVLIYFRAELSEQTLDQLASVVTPGGYIVLGTSEFHLRTRELLPTRIAERIFLQRPIGRSQDLSSEQVTGSAPDREPDHETDRFAARLQTGPTEMKPARVPALHTQEANAIHARLPSLPDAPPRTTLVATLVVLLFSGNHDAVLGEALPVLMRDSEQQPMLILAGIAYHMKGRHYEAAAVLEKTLRQHPSCWPAAYFLAASLEALGRRDEALAIYRQLDSSGALGGANPPSPAAQALVDLLNLQPWKSEVMALARRRLTGSSDQTSPIEVR